MSASGQLEQPNVEGLRMRTTVAILPIIALSGTVAAEQLNVPEQFSTIQSAIDAAQGGDVVLVAAGTYAESIDFLGKGITVRSVEGPDNTTIDATDLDASAVRFWNSEGLITTLDGFHITGGTGTMMSGLYRGGGIYVQSASPTIRNCRISGNQADAGGGVGVWAGNPWLFDCRIEGNIAIASGTAGGGGMHLFSSFPRLVNVEFRSNQGVGFAPGGAISMHDLSDAELVNCVFLGNRGRHCGGIYNTNSAVEIYNSTFSGNAATNSSNGEALKIYGSMSEGLVVNCIFWNNGDAGVADEIDTALGEVVVNNSCVQGGWTGNGVSNVNVDPMFVNPDGGDVHLRLESPLLDIGNNAYLPDDIETDMDAKPRFADHDNPEIPSPNVDLGPFEVQPPDVPPACDGDIDGNNSVDLGDLLTVIAAWGPCGTSTGCAGDIDGDGFVDLSDLLTVIANWGDCPE